MEQTKQHHLLDLKVPLGGILTFYGIVLAVYGFLTSGIIPSIGSDLYTRSLGINVNLLWGLLMLIGGGGILIYSFAKNVAKNKLEQ